MEINTYKKEINTFKKKIKHRQKEINLLQESSFTPIKKVAQT